MEFLLIPAVALGSLYIINKDKKAGSNVEPMSNYQVKTLPNTDIPNKNYPSEFPVLSNELDQTSKLSNNNHYSNSGGTYTDKFFNYAGLSSTDSVKGGNYRSVTGEMVDQNYFKHNNMVPFYGGKLRTNHTLDNVNEGTLDSYTGSGSQIIRKKETTPLFPPHNNTEWSHGMPNVNDFMQSRVNPSKNMANVKPFADQKVAPGLGLGYTSEGAGGFNAGMGNRELWMEPTVDQLRVLTKQKASGIGMLGHEGPASHFVQKRGELGIQEKHRPDTHFEMGPERYMTTVGAEKGHALIPVPIVKDVNRPETTVSYQGGASYANSAEYVVGEYHEPHGVQLESYPVKPAVAKGKGLATENDFQNKTTKAYMNNRSVGKQGDYFGSVRGYVTETMAPLLDVLKPSRKQNAVGTIRPYQNPKTPVCKSYLFNPHDKTKTTMRQTTETSQNHLIINRNTQGLGGAYETTPHQPINNARMTTGDHFYVGGSSANDGTKQMRSYEAEYAQRNNDVKSSTVVGYTPSGNAKMFNNHIHVETTTQREGFTKNNRDMVPNFPNQGPNTGIMGQMNSNSGLYSGVQLDRNNGDILDQLAGNPYAISVHH